MCAATAAESAPRRSPSARGHLTPFLVHAGGSAIDLPLCLLVNEETCSGAEIFAAAMQDHGRGKLVGTTTFGSGTGLHSFRLSNGSGLHLGVVEWFSPAGRSNWRRGVMPDIAVRPTSGARILVPEESGALGAVALQQSLDTQLLQAIAILRFSDRFVGAETNETPRIWGLLLKHAGGLLTFLNDARVPADNNGLSRRVLNGPRLVDMCFRGQETLS